MKKAALVLFLVFGTTAFGQQFIIEKDTITKHFYKLIKPDFNPDETKKVAVGFSRDYFRKRPQLSIYNPVTGVDTNYTFGKPYYEYKNVTLDFEREFFCDDLGRYVAQLLK